MPKAKRRAGLRRKFSHPYQSRADRGKAFVESLHKGVRRGCATLRQPCGDTGLPPVRLQCTDMRRAFRVPKRGCGSNPDTQHASDVADCDWVDAALRTLFSALGRAIRARRMGTWKEDVLMSVRTLRRLCSRCPERECHPCCEVHIMFNGLAVASLQTRDRSFEIHNDALRDAHRADAAEQLLAHTPVSQDVISNIVCKYL